MYGPSSPSCIWYRWLWPHPVLLCELLSRQDAMNATRSGGLWRGVLEGNNEGVVFLSGWSSIILFLLADRTRSQGWASVESCGLHPDIMPSLQRASTKQKGNTYIIDGIISEPSLHFMSHESVDQLSWWHQFCLTVIETHRILCHHIRTGWKSSSLWDFQHIWEEVL